MLLPPLLQDLDVPGVAGSLPPFDLGSKGRSITTGGGGTYHSRRCESLESSAWHSSALGAFLSAGRGVVVTFDDQDEVRYSTIEDLRDALVEAPGPFEPVPAISRTPVENQTS